MAGSDVRAIKLALKAQMQAFERNLDMAQKQSVQEREDANFAREDAAELRGKLAAVPRVIGPIAQAEGAGS